VRNEPKKKRKSGAEDQAGHNREVKRGVFAAVNDISRKSSEAKGKLAAKIKQDAKNDQKCPQKEKHPPELAKRVH